MRAFEVLTVTNQTKTIQGVATTVVHDSLYLNGRLREDTIDWYAQDKHGTVWYFGEDTKTLDDKGQVESRSGSFQAGRDGARAGIFMPGKPKVGQAFQQEYYKGQAEDHFQILSLRMSERPPRKAVRSAVLLLCALPLGIDRQVALREVPPKCAAPRRPLAPARREAPALPAARILDS